MATSSEMAKATAEIARDDAKQSIHDAGDAFRSTLALALERMVELTIAKQGKVTEDMDLAELAIVKVNVTQAAEAAIASVELKLANLDIDKLSKDAERNHTGKSFVQSAALLSPLLRITGELLESAGYDVNAMRSPGGTYNISLLPNIDYAAGTAARNIDRAIEKYGKAQIAVDEAIEAETEARARQRWNDA